MIVLLTENKKDGRMDEMSKKKYMAMWIAAAVIFIAVLGIVWMVEFGDNEDKPLNRFPRDAVEASLKMTGAGYSVTVEDDVYMLASMESDASEMYKIAFSGQIVSYMTVSDAETGELQAEIFYFEYNSDAKLLYDKMVEDWNFEKEEGELRIKDKTIYMGYAKTLDVLEK